MTGSQKVITALNVALGNELRAIAQYRQDAAVLVNMNLPALAKYLTNFAGQEEEHLGELLERITFLGGQPAFQPTGTEYRADVEAILRGNLQLEMDARNEYQDLVDLSRGERDEKTALLSGDTEGDEEGHINWLEGEIANLERLGITAYVTGFRSKEGA